MTAIRLLALDLDGTVLTQDLHMSDRTRTAVAATRALGVHVVIATGRMYRSTLRYASMLDLPGPLICYQGGYVRERPAADGTPGLVWIGLTGVRREWRGKGIALALKLMAMRWAQRSGYVCIRTGKASNNVPILTLNKQLGFVREPWRVLFSRKL